MTTQKNAARGTYVVEIETGDSMSMSTLRIGKTTGCVVKFDADGMIAHRGPRYFLGDEPRNMKANAGRTRLAFQRYYDRTGKRWEVELKEQREAKKAVKAEEQRRAKLVREAAPDLLAALKHALKRTGPDAVIEAAIAKAEG